MVGEPCHRLRVRAVALAGVLRHRRGPEQVGEAVVTEGTWDMVSLQLAVPGSGPPGPGLRQLRSAGAPGPRP